MVIIVGWDQAQGGIRPPAGSIVVGWDYGTYGTHGTYDYGTIGRGD